ncbi:MAG: hypothetical protein JRD89_01940 [Deltaproteobacteria bacterium]|nr:hypothetical protein [Deltaproteobacteria bacterium]
MLYLVTIDNCRALVDADSESSVIKIAASRLDYVSEVAEDTMAIPYVGDLRLAKGCVFSWLD